MKKLLTSAAVCGLVLAASPAHAQVSLDIGGYFKGYGFYTDQDDNSAAEDREFDIIRNTEVHLTGETTLDNGLTVGIHFEMEADASGPDDSFDVQESYAYFSGGWGRVNFGAEDGAAYLLQVSAPSADSNIDGIRQYVNPVNYNVLTGGIITVGAVNGLGGIDYDQDPTGYSDKLTYLSPILNGFQFGLSYTPDIGDASDEDSQNLDDVADSQGEAYEAAVRYEGMFSNVGVTLGAGYSHVELEEENAVLALGDFTDDQTAWNVGADFDIGPFGLGVSYSEDDSGEIADGAGGTFGEEEVLVVGVDYTTGPFKLGASYYDSELDLGTGARELETDRYTGGVVYTYGPGMTFRGSISYIEHENVGALGDLEATSILLGTQINF